MTIDQEQKIKVGNSAIALGSNLGDSRSILENAIGDISQIPGIMLISRSSWYQTKPIGPPQPDYINGCITLQVQQSPEELLDILLNIENKFGRVRDIPWGARTLDLDIILFDQLIIHKPMIQIPHPRMYERAFVLVPLAEIAPQWLDPVSGKAIAELVKSVNCSGVELIN